MGYLAQGPGLNQIVRLRPGMDRSVRLLVECSGYARRQASRAQRWLRDGHLPTLFPGDWLSSRLNLRICPGRFGLLRLSRDLGTGLPLGHENEVLARRVCVMWSAMANGVGASNLDDRMPPEPAVRQIPTYEKFLILIKSIGLIGYFNGESAPLPALKPVQF
jgi:hypothetical protein